MSRNRRKGRRHQPKSRRRRTPHPTRSKSSKANNHQSAHEHIERWHPEEWSKSRKGAIASRGYHFQDAVGAWFASRIACGDLEHDYLIPEGTDDFELDAPTDFVFIQAKSRQGRLGQFQIGAATEHIAATWNKHLNQINQRTRFLIVLEQGIKGADDNILPPLVETPLKDLTSAFDNLHTLVAKQMARKSIDTKQLHTLIEATSLVACSWSGLEADTQQLVANINDMPPAALAIVSKVIRSSIAEAIDHNAQVTFTERLRFNRTRLVEIIITAAGHIDLDSLNRALTLGLCSPIDMQPTESKDEYYSGMSTEPRHVSAGLVIPRPDLIEQVSQGLLSNRSVLLTGPSGVGKSAILWTIPNALPGVLWLRVHRISKDTVLHVVRLLRAYNASPEAPVGLLVDAAGQGDLEEWATLRRAVTAIPGAWLAGTARNEDLFLLGDLADTEIVKVYLDERTASAIHAGLHRRGDTRLEHWQESFQQSDGLTLEYTHMLTRGTRLSAVLSDQISARVAQRREVELSILAIVATADRWSAPINSEKLSAHLKVKSLDFKEALTRLENEHLLTHDDGILKGTHQIRSRGIVDIIHRLPPPTLISSVQTVMDLVDTKYLPRFIFEVLRAQPILGEQIQETLTTLVYEKGSTLAPALHGLELYDFYRLASCWLSELDLLNFPPAHQLTVMGFVITDVEFPETFPKELKDAHAKLQTIPPPCESRRHLIAKLGLTSIADLISNCRDPNSIQALLRGLHHLPVENQGIQKALSCNQSLLHHLHNCDVTQLGDFIATTCGVSLQLAISCVAMIGGVEAILDRIRTEEPWIQQLYVNSESEHTVGYARFLLVSEKLQGPSRDQSLNLSRKLLRSLPMLDKADVVPILPDGSEFEELADNIDVSSGLLQKYDFHPDEIVWNKRRIRLVRTLRGVSETERLTEAYRLFPSIISVARNFGNAFLLAGMLNQSNLDNMVNQLETVSNAGKQLCPKLSVYDDDVSDEIQLLDPVISLISNICGNVLMRLYDPDQYLPLSTYISNQVLGKDIPDVKSLPWQLIGMSEFPSDLDDLAEILSNMNVVLKELSSTPDSNASFRNTALAGNPQTALARVAKQARRSTSQQEQRRRNEVNEALRQLPTTIDIIWFDGCPLDGVAPNFAVTVRCDLFRDWYAVKELTISECQELRLPFEAPLIVPVICGHAVPMLTVQVTDGVSSIHDFGAFTPKLPNCLDEQMTSFVNDAIHALQICSGLSVLGLEQDLDGRVANHLDDSVKGFNNAVGAVEALGDCNVIQDVANMLRELAGLISVEWEEPIRRGNYAMSKFTSLFGKSVPTFVDIGCIALMLSLYWDADPIYANEVWARLTSD